MNPRSLAYLQILGGALLLSSGATVIKAVSFSALELAAWRAVVIAGFLWMVIRPPRQCWDRALIPAAIAHAITTLLFMWGNKLTSAATAIFLQYTAPIYLLLLGPWLLKEPVVKSDIGVIALIAAGMGLLLSQPALRTATASDPALGSLVAAACGLTWAFTTLTMRGLARRTDHGFERSITAVIIANLALALCLIPAVGVPATASTQDWLLVSYMGVFQLGTAFILIALGLRRVTALEGALLLLLEPVINPLWAWLVHAEVPGITTLLGGALILLATALRAVLSTRRSSS
jgi:drug/metabolite transporter, DME family